MATIELRRLGDPLAVWEATVWEWTSTAMWAVLIPAIVVFERWRSRHFGLPRRNLP